MLWLVLVAVDGLLKFKVLTCMFVVGVMSVAGGSGGGM